MVSSSRFVHLSRRLTILRSKIDCFSFRRNLSIFYSISQLIEAPTTDLQRARWCMIPLVRAALIRTRAEIPLLCENSTNQSKLRAWARGNNRDTYVEGTYFSHKKHVHTYGKFGSDLVYTHNKHHHKQEGGPQSTFPSLLLSFLLLGSLLLHCLCLGSYYPLPLLNLQLHETDNYKLHHQSRVHCERQCNRQHALELQHDSKNLWVL